MQTAEEDATCLQLWIVQFPHLLHWVSFILLTQLITFNLLGFIRSHSNTAGKVALGTATRDKPDADKG